MMLDLSQGELAKAIAQRIAPVGPGVALSRVYNIEGANDFYGAAPFFDLEILGS